MTLNDENDDLGWGAERGKWGEVTGGGRPSPAMTRDPGGHRRPGTAHDARNAANRAGYGNRDTPEMANLKTDAPICCFISTKTEIPHDYGAPWSPGAAASLRTALTATTDH